MKIITRCDGCSCLQIDAYDFTGCGAGFDNKYRSDLRAGKKEIPKDWSVFSMNCELIKIVKGREIEKREAERPERWWKWNCEGKADIYIEK